MQLKDKKCTVFGLGVSGSSATRFLVKAGANVSVINQGAPESWKEFQQFRDLNLLDQSDAKAQEVMERSDIVVLSPGIPRSHPLLLKAHSQGVPVISEIELAYRFVSFEKMLAITGSNGKTTTVTLLAQALEALNKKVFLGGNIGTPLCDLAISEEKVDFIVLELSSFQLESMIDFKADVSAILNLTMNHGERYQSLEDYAFAKFHITDRQNESDTFIFDQSSELLEKWITRIPCQLCPLELHDPIVLKKELETRYDLSKLKLAGTHNLANLRVVDQFLEVLKLPKAGLQQVIDTFPGVHHRVEFVEHSGEFVCYNDAKSTNWDATMAALKAMEGKPQPLWLVLGGQPRGQGEVPSKEILHYLRDHVEMVLVIGAAQSFLQKELGNHVKVFLAENLQGMAKQIKEKKFAGTLLFSPAFPSFDQFSNYVDRGEKFKQTIIGIES